MKRTAVFWLGVLGGFSILISFSLGRPEERLALLLFGVAAELCAVALVWRHAKRRP